MQELQHYDVIICGGGMVGLGMALALAQGALRVALLDPQPLPADPAALRPGLAQPDFDARVSALTPASRALLAALGVWQELAELRLCPYTDMHVWDADGTGSIHFAAAELHQPCLGYIVENRLVSAVLARAVQATGKIEVLCASLAAFTSEGDIQRITLANGAQLACRLLIGADGGNSPVRTLAGIATREWDTGHRALVTTVKTAQSHQNTAWQRFLPSGPLAFLPLYLPGAAAQQYCSIVWSCVPALADELLSLDDASFAQRLGAAFEQRLGSIDTVAARQAFPLWQKHASHYVQPGLALIGDAAHTIHPLAGQGVNLGLADVQCLARVLSHAAARGEDIASVQVLSRYQRERKAANLGMLLVMEGFKRTFGSENLPLRWLRNTGLKAVDTLTPFKHAVMKGAMGL